MISTFRQVTSIVRVLTPVRTFVSSCVKLRDERHDVPYLQIQESSIPSYVERKSEDTRTKKARLLYQSRKRGMLENGLLLSTFADKYLNYFDDKQLQLYDHLINLPSNDWDIFYWATGAKPVPPEFDNEVMTLLKKHIQNEDRQSRITQPDL